MACLDTISLFICDVALAKKFIMLSYYFWLDSFMNYKFFWDKIGAGGLLLFLLIAATIRGQPANRSTVCLSG